MKNSTFPLFLMSGEIIRGSIPSTYDDTLEFDQICRWVSSHHRAYDKIRAHWKALVEFFDELEFKYSVEFSQATLDEAEKLNQFLRNQHAMALMIYYIDVLDVLMNESKLFQKSGSTVVGQESRKENLKKALTKIRNHNGFLFKQFLMQTNCFETLKEAQNFIDGIRNV